VDTLPRTQTGKLQRFELRRLAADDRIATSLTAAE
jgi:acyl-coenzyme A synthetase/AMP-(fatty) acid ligase